MWTRAITLMTPDSNRTRGRRMTGGRLSGVRFPAVIAMVIAIATPTGAGALARDADIPDDVGRIERRFDNRPEPRSLPPLELPEPDKAPAPAAAASVRLTLNEIVLDNATAHEPGALAHMWADLLNREVSLAEIYTLRDALTARYRSDGYILSQVVIPAQTIRDGVVHLRAVEGYIAKVSFSGDATDRLGALDHYAERITAEHPLRGETLERYVMLADDLPGMTARTVLKPAEGTTGGSELIFTLERQPVSAAAGVDNRGTKSVGPIQVDLSTELNNVAGLLEQVTVRGIGSEQLSELKYLDLGYNQVLDGEGTTLSLAFRRSASRPGDTVAPLDVSSSGDTYRVALSHPFMRTRASSLRGEASFTLRDSRTVAFEDVLSFDRVRVAALGLTYDVADELKGANVFQAQIHKGLPILGSSASSDEPVSREGGRHDFVKVTGFAQRDQPIDAGVSLSASVEGQYSPHQLLSSDEYGVGGKGYGRAYDPSEITGDAGFAGRLELRYLAPPIAPKIDYVQLYAFSEYGAVWNHESSRYRHRSLADVGVGVRFSVAGALNGNLELGCPLTEIPGSDTTRDVRLFYGFSVRF